MFIPFKKLKNRIKTSTKKRTKDLKKCPQKKGVCLRVFTTTPRKPNSGNRKIAKVCLTNGRVIQVYIPGIGHNLQKHSRILVHGGRAKDTPGIRYTAIRGKYDLDPLHGRKNKRSKYGVKKV